MEDAMDYYVEKVIEENYQSGKLCMNVSDKERKKIEAHLEKVLKG